VLHENTTTEKLLSIHAPLWSAKQTFLLGNVLAADQRGRTWDQQPSVSSTKGSGLWIPKVCCGAVNT